MVVNDPEMRSGGAVAVASTNASAVELILHETGHTFALLADEYGGPPSVVRSVGRTSSLNATKDTNRGSNKWGVWIAASTPLPTTGTTNGVPGAYAGAAYCDAGLFRPTFNSKMRSLGQPFDTINVEQHIRRIYNYVSPIDGSAPSASTGTSPKIPADIQRHRTQPLTHDLEIVWRIDGTPAGTGPSFNGGAMPGAPTSCR